MDQAPVHPSVAILEQMDIYEPESGRSRLEDCVQAILPHAVIRVQQVCHQTIQVIGPGADELRQRIPGMVPFTQENAIVTQTRLHESGVLDEDSLKADNFFQSEWILPGLQDRAAPSLQAVPRWTFPFYFKARTTIGQQHKTGGARDQKCARTSHRLEGLSSKIEV